MRVSDQERHLAGFLQHIASYVDGIVALDGSSSGSTLQILHREPKVLSVLRAHSGGLPEARDACGKHRLVLEAARFGATWVLCADADERFENAFLSRMQDEARSGERWCRPLRYVELVDLRNSQSSTDHANWARTPRWSARLFRIPLTISRRKSGVDQPWFPAELDGSRHARMRTKVHRLAAMESADLGVASTQSPGGTGRVPSPILEGCLADPAFAHRFHVVPASTQSVCLGQKPEPSMREWQRLYGFDFEAIFAGLQAGSARNDQHSQ